MKEFRIVFAYLTRRMDVFSIKLSIFVNNFAKELGIKLEIMHFRIDSPAEAVQNSETIKCICTAKSIVYVNFAPLLDGCFRSKSFEVLGYTYRWYHRIIW